MTEEELDLLLRQDPTIPHHEWGINTAKSREDLLAEVHEEAAVLTVGRNPETGGACVIRETWVLLLSVYYMASESMRLILVEKVHRLANGSSFTRVDEMNASMTEKMRVGRSIMEEILRALAEELGITDLAEEERESISIYSGEGFVLPDNPARTDLHTSRSYPGIWTKQHTVRASVALSPRHFVADGYVERQFDKHGKLAKEVEFEWMTQEQWANFSRLMRSAKEMLGREAVNWLPALLAFVQRAPMKKDPLPQG